MKGRRINFTAPNLPKSVTSSWISLAGLTGFLVSVYMIRVYNIGVYVGGVIAGLSLAVPIIFLEFVALKTFRRESTGLNFKHRNPLNVKRVLIKLLGLYVTLALVACVYLVLPEYRDGYYWPYWRFVKYLAAIIVVGSIPYYFILDMYLVEPKETYWKVGMIALGQWEKTDFKGLKNHFLGWLVKLFFLPLMYVPLCGNIGIIKGSPLPLVIQQQNFGSFYNYMYNMIFTIDLVFVFVGYILTLRIFDSHIRSVEPSFLGWYVALQCYKPFWDAISSHYFAYNNDNYDWGQWLFTHHVLFILWGSVIIILLSIYSWASITFGIRFSNLTHRGILTNGPYRFMRHPAYVCKNISWWLISIPFISHVSPFDAVKNCLMILGVNTIYFLRAKTEERHLSKDPVYVAYANGINEKGIFRGLFRKVPFLRYDAEKHLGLGFLKTHI